MSTFRSAETWVAKMDGLGDLELFVAVVDGGGISAAARKLDSSPPAVSRRLTALEARLGVRLADRSARRFRLTDEGVLLHARGRTILSELRDAEAEVSTRGAVARGRLRVGAPMELGRRRVARLLADFAARHPGLDAHLVLSDAGLEVGEEGLDVVLRIGMPGDPSIIARKIATCPRVICAAPSYLAARGAPLVPDDLADHDCLRLARRDRIRDDWRFLVDGAERIVKVTGALSSSSGDVLHAWAIEGRGFSSEAMWDVDDDLAQGRLVECLEAYRCDDVELFAAFAPGKPTPPRIRLFVDFIVAAFATRGQTNLIEG